jgi:hypothetical protein
MSASREKMRRKQAATEGGGKTVKKSKSEINSLIFRNFIRLACVLLVLALIAVILVGQGIPQQYLTAVTAHGQNITVSEFAMFYRNSLQDFYNDMGQMLFAYGMLDPDIPLSRQASFTEGASWHDVIVNNAVNDIWGIVLWSEMAKQEGIALTDEDIDMINSIMDNARTVAASQGLNVNKLLSQTYGRGVNEDNYRVFLERQLFASRYERTMYESFSFSEQELAEHYEANKNSFDSVDYREFRVSRFLTEAEYIRLLEADPDGQLRLDEMVDSPIGEITYETKLAYDRAAALLNNSDLTEFNFNELAALLAFDEDRVDYDDPDFTLIKGALFSGGTVNQGHDPEACDYPTHNHSHSHNQDTGPLFEADLGDWLFGERSRGDITLIQDGNDFVVAMFLERFDNPDWQTDVEEVLRIRDFNELRTERSANAPAPSRNWLGMLLVTGG